MNNALKTAYKQICSVQNGYAFDTLCKIHLGIRITSGLRICEISNNIAHSQTYKHKPK